MVILWCMELNMNPVLNCGSLLYLYVFMYRLDIPPGTKVRLVDPEFCHGRILLRSSTISILGGLVPDLVELWKSQEVCVLMQ